MKKLHTFQFAERLQAGMYQDLLKQEGIDCLLRNEQLSTALGEIPFIECAPELWLIDAETWPRAKLLLDSWLSAVSDQPEWHCSGCGELSLGHFHTCWSCGRANELKD